MIAAPEKHNRKRLSRVSSSYLSPTSVADTLTTIHEGRVYSTIPKPIWPKIDLHCDGNDSLTDEVMLYTNSNLLQLRNVGLVAEELSLKEILVDLLNGIDATLQHKDSAAEELLERVNEKIIFSMEALKDCTEEDIRKLCVNLSNSKNILSVIRALSNSSCNSTGGNLSQFCQESEEIYQIPSASSSSGFSDSFKQLNTNQLPVFVHENLSNVPNGLRNAMIYGTLYRGHHKPSADRRKLTSRQKKGLLQAFNDNKPSVWEQYYGVNAAPNGLQAVYSSNPADIPIYICDKMSN